MSAIIPPVVVYPDSDGKLMADNTLQYQWIVTIQGNLDLLFAGRPDVFVAGDHLIYPVEGNPKRRTAPDVYVAFGRPKGHRGSYKVFEEGGIFPQVVFEVRSPGNRAGEMAKKLLFYDRFGAEEYYDYDPDRNRLLAYTRRVGGPLNEVPEPNGHVSSRLGVRFDLSGPELVLTGPDGRRFLTFVELGNAQRATEQRAADERRRADEERMRADAEARRADDERRMREKLAAKLRELGVDPDAV